MKTARHSQNLLCGIDPSVNTQRSTIESRPERFLSSRESALLFQAARLLDDLAPSSHSALLSIEARNLARILFTTINECHTQ